MRLLFREIGERVAAAAPESYFVGGCVRDLLRGVPIKDLDLALHGDTFAVGRVLAREFNGHVFWMREEEGVARIVLPGQGGLQLDLSPLRGTPEEDLLARDLTINAMAQPTAEGLQLNGTILDPAGGKEDLAARRIRFVQPSAPERDPLRVMRALRFRWQLDFALVPETEQRVRECAPLLARVSVERIRDELFYLLALDNADQALAELLRFDIGRWLFGREISDREAPARCVGSLLRIFSRLEPAAAAFFVQEPTPPRRRREVALWAAALLPLGADIPPGDAARYLALSNAERHLIKKGLENQDAARDLVRRWPVAGSERWHFWRRARPAEPEAVLLAAAEDGWSPPYASLLAEALQHHLSPPQPLLSGQEIMQMLGIPPGPEVGRLLDAVEEARADGLLENREAALDWLRASSC